ncbi:hypothetical protein B0H10DRAFT_1949633 [Mycena sp. CBHHK59/15]|nr:hypothetical protein B0H10DRAFT_1949633 [Mycena sp. CBHHK59/15]
MFESKNAEGTDIVAIATAFYRSMTNQHCKAKGDGQFECGGHVVMRKYRMVFNFYFISFSRLIQIQGKSNRKHHFIGCSNWSDGDGLSHCFTKIPPQACVDENDLRAVIIPKAGVLHNHPAFVRTKTPYQVAQKYKKAAETTGVIGQTTLRIDKAASTRALLDGKLPQEIHPSMVNNRKRREIIRSVRAASFPDGTRMKAVLREFEKDKSHNIGDCYIDSVIMQANMDITITVNLDLAELVHDASCIMVDTTFTVGHSTTDEWKLLIWLKGLDKRTVIRHVWSNKATHEAFVVVWNGIFEAIKSITGKSLNFKERKHKASVML